MLMRSFPNFMRKTYSQIISDMYPKSLNSLFVCLILKSTENKETINTVAERNLIKPLL